MIKNAAHVSVPFVLGGGGPDPGVLELLSRQGDQCVDLLDRVIAAGRVCVADLAIAFAGVRQPIERDTHADEAAMCVLAPPIGFDPRPCFLDRIHRPRE